MCRRIIYIFCPSSNSFVLVCKIWKLVVPLLDDCTNWYQLVACKRMKNTQTIREHKHTEIWNKQWQFVFTKSTKTNDFARDQQRRCNFNEWMVSKLIEHLLHSFDQNVLIEMSFVLIKLVNIFFSTQIYAKQDIKKNVRIGMILIMTHSRCLY